MILTIYAKRWEHLDDDRLKITADVESFKEVLRAHSPNLLIDYLNEEHGTKIPRIPYERKEADDDNTSNR